MSKARRRQFLFGKLANLKKKSRFCWVILLLISDVDPNQHCDFGRFLYEFPMLLAFLLSGSIYH